MAIEIRNNDKIQGITVGKYVYKICQLADDTTIFINDMDSIAKVVKIFQQFQKCSGLKINLEKSEVIPIGTQKLKEITLPKCVSKLSVNRNYFKTLGIYYTYESNEATKLNFEPKINSIKTIINIWSARQLSLKGKVLIIKTLILPQINYLLASIYTPKNMLAEVDNLLFQFLWNKKTPKVKKACIISNYETGGLKMPDIFSINVAAKVKWIKKLLKIEKNEKWEYLFLELFTIGKNNLNKKLPDNFRNKCFTNFHKQVFECWNTCTAKKQLQ